MDESVIQSKVTNCDLRDSVPLANVQLPLCDNLMPDGRPTFLPGNFKIPVGDGLMLVGKSSLPLSEAFFPVGNHPLRIGKD